MDMRQFLIESDTEFLREAAALVDNRLDKLYGDVKVHPDPFGYGLIDSIDYVLGFGFVACQTYVPTIVKWSDLDKREALKLGPRHRSGRPMIELVHACANYWKHNAEWALDSPRPREQITIDIIASLGVDTSKEYPMPDALHQLLDPHPPRIKYLIPFLTQWRDEVLACSKGG